jgi:hypothetical protein
MPAVRLDFTGVEVSNFEPVPAGDYEARIDKSEYGESKAGKPVWKIEWTVETEGRQKRVFQTLSLQPQALFKAKGVLQALGYTEEELSGEFDFDPELLVDYTAVVSLGYREYEGNTYNEVNAVYPLDAPAPPAPTKAPSRR